MNSGLIFCSIIYPGPQGETNNLLLAESIRKFGGGLAGEPIWFFLPDYGKPLTVAGQKHLQKLNVRLIPFKIDRVKLQFFFMGQLAGLDQAERLSSGKTGILAWMDSNTILLHEPGDFLLPTGKSLGCCPVHHLLLGSRYDQPLDPFWSQVYHSCGVPPERVFPMKPVVEDLQMRPYFNAGLLVTRPEKGLFQEWHRTFLDHYQSAPFQDFYKQNQNYIIFMHQALLAGVVIKNLAREEILELPATYNYPVHLYEKDATGRRPTLMDDVVTFRHEGFYENADWLQKFPASEHLKRWLEGKLALIQKELL